MPISADLAHDLSAALGLRRGTLGIAEPNPRWQELALRYVAELQTELPGAAIGIEHIGSTAVPGLAAKPILDVAVGVDALAHVEEVTAALAAFGLLPRGVDRSIEFNQNFGFEVEERVRLVNTHLVRHGGQDWERYLIFRDRLRAEPAARDAYAVLKRRLAGELGSDRVGYVDAKADFVQEITRSPVTNAARADRTIPFAEARGLAESNAWREKCLLYVTRHPDELLVLEHTEEFPDAGIQVPAGGVDPGEDPYATALRELAEETGLLLDQVPVHLESRHWEGSEAPSRIRHYFWVTAPRDTPDRWSHLVGGTDGDRGMRFWLTFRPRTQPDLTPGYGWDSALGSLATRIAAT